MSSHPSINLQSVYFIGEEHDAGDQSPVESAIVVEDNEENEGTGTISSFSVLQIRRGNWDNFGIISHIFP